MAKKESNVSLKRKKVKISRPGVHSKNKASKVKSSKSYIKKNRGQG